MEVPVQPLNIEQSFMQSFITLRSLKNDFNIRGLGMIQNEKWLLFHRDEPIKVERR